MDIYKARSFESLMDGNSYPGRGIVVGQSPDGTKAVVAYFIMGRSSNSRNRIFKEEDGSVFTAPLDESKVEDPSLIIYAAVRSLNNHLVVTNGDQTDTIIRGLGEGLDFYKSLEARSFEPDRPNFTPRISADIEFCDNSFSYRMSILKSADSEGTACNRFGYNYVPQPGVGHLVHTYECDGDPLPSFQGEPRRVEVSEDIDEFSDNLWKALDSDNKISLYVRYIDVVNGASESRLINKYGE